MRRLVTVAVVGLALAATATVATAQGGARRPGGGRGGMMDSTARAARRDSMRARGADTLMARRRDSLRAAGMEPGRGRMGPGRGRGGLGGPGGPGRGFGGSRALLAGIQLSETERSNVEAIGKKYAEQMRQLREANPDAQPGQNEQLRAQVQALAEKERAEVRAALSTEHQAEFDANVQRFQARGARGGPPPGRLAPGARPPR